MKRAAFVSLCIACGALFGGAVPAAAADSSLGRLFFTPSQRSSLDIARTQRARTTLATEKTEEVATAAPAPQSITYDGSVRRSDGQSTVWINHRPVSDKEAVGGAVVVGKVRQDGSVSLQMPQSGRSVELKPGQSVELLSGAIEESYSRKPAAAPEEKPAAKPAAKGAPGAKAEKSAADSERARTTERDREDRERPAEESARAVRDAAAGKAAAPAGATEAPR